MVVLFFFLMQFLYLWINFWRQGSRIPLELLYHHYNLIWINTHVLLWKLSNDFTEQFEFCYSAQYPEPPRNAFENAILKWKALNNEREPAEKGIWTVRNEWVSKNKVRKRLGSFHLFVYNRTGKLLNGNTFLGKMRLDYKPTENQILNFRNFKFWETV